MEVKIIRLSRPLLLPSETNNEGYLYKTIYGFVIVSELDNTILEDIEGYVGYLASLHLYYNGNPDGDFTINNELRGMPDWVDKEGITHTTFDPWMDDICLKAKSKLNLSYTIIPMDLELDEFSCYVNEDLLLVDEEYYYFLEELPEPEPEPGSEPEMREPYWERIEEDELPF